MCDGIDLSDEERIRTEVLRQLAQVAEADDDEALPSLDELARRALDELDAREQIAAEQGRDSTN